MKIVYSHWSLGKEPFKEMVACSNRLAQAHGYETILYTDKKGEEDLKNIKFSEIRRFPDKLHKVSKRVWSLGKLAAMSDMDEPFFHIDQDLFLYRDVLKSLRNNDFVCFHQEPGAEGYLDLFRIKKHFKNVQPASLENDYEIKSYNFAVVGGLAYKTIKQVTSEILDVCIEKKEIFETFGDRPDDHHKMAIFAEQVWIPAVMIKNNIYPSFVLDLPVNEDTKKNYLQLIRDTAKKVGVAHFWTGSKSKYRQEIIAYAKKLGVSY